MRKFKKAMALLLAVMMMLSVAIVSVSAEEEAAAVTVRGTLPGCDWENGIAMELAEGVYTYTFEAVPAGNYQFKVVEGETWYGGANGANIDVAVSQEADVTVTFNPETKELGFSGDGVGAVTGLDVKTMQLMGFSSWEFATAPVMTEVETGVYSISFPNVEADTYEYKFAANGGWDANWGAGTDKWAAEGDAVWNSQTNFGLDLEADSSVTFTIDLTGFDFESKTGAVYSVSVSAPEDETQPATDETQPATDETQPATDETQPATDATEPVTEEPIVVESAVVCGSINLCGAGSTTYGWDPSDETNVMTKGEDGKFTLTKTLTAEGGVYEFKVVINPDERNEKDELPDANWIGDANYKFTMKADGEATIVFDPETLTYTVEGENVEQVKEIKIDSLRAVGNGDGAWLNGVAWGPNADENLMTADGGVYSITFTGVPKNGEDLANYQVKFTANGTDWADNWGGVFTAFGEMTDAEYNSQNNITFVLDQYDYNDVTIVVDASELQADGSGVKFEIEVAEGTAPATQPTEPATGETTPIPEAGWYVVGSPELCGGVSWADNGVSPTCKMTNVDGVWTVTLTNIAAGEYNFKVVETNSKGSVKQWHPDGMGNDSAVSVAVDGSTVVITLVPQLNPSEDAAVATVYAPGEVPTEEVTEPATETTEATEPVTEPAKTTVKFASSSKSVTYGKTVTVKATVKNGSGTTTYTSSNKKVATVDKNGKVTTKGAGTAKITATNNGVKATYTLKVTKAANTIKAASKKTISLKASAVKKTAKTYKATTFAVKKAQGTVVYTKTSKKGVSVDKKGKITVKKGTKKGTYKLTVKITAKGNANYSAKTVKTVLTVKVK